MQPGLLSSYPKESMTKRVYTVNGFNNKTLASTVVAEFVYVADVREITFQGRNLVVGGWVLDHVKPDLNDTYEFDGVIHSVVGWSRYKQGTGITHWQAFLQ